MRKAGFTLLEALAVLGVTALTLSLLYTVGMRGAVTVYRLGDRAVSTADLEVAKTGYHAVISSLVVPPVAVSSALAETVSGQDQPVESFIGAPAAIESPFIALRDTPCARAGTAGRLTLTIESDAASTTVFCSLTQGAGADEIVGDPVALVAYRFGGAAFSYSEDGVEWVDEWLVERGLPVETQALPNGELRQVFIRLASEDGLSQVIALASSGRAISQTPPQTGGRGGRGGRG